MFTIEDREALRTELIDTARKDKRITGAALVGSASIGAEDRWSDIDLSFGVRSEAEVVEVLQAFTDRMVQNYDVVDTLDSPQGRWTQRIFLLANTLQVDLAFIPEDGFGAGGPTFQLLFGRAIEPVSISPSDAGAIVGAAWLYALHVRSSVVRNKRWQAEFMVSGMRDQALALACLRHGLPSGDGRGLDALPELIRRSYEETLVRSLEPDELVRAFRATTNLLVEEIRVVHPDLTDRLEETLRLLDGTSQMG